MDEIYLPFAMAALVLLAGLISIRLGLSVAWIDFLAGFGGVLLTFLAAFFYCYVGFMGHSRVLGRIMGGSAANTQAGGAGRALSSAHRS